MYHQPSKRKQLTQRIFIYCLMSLAVVFLVFILVFFMLGYQFNKADGRIEQGGLVQFNSQPSGAVVTIDGQNLGTRTAAKTTLSAGQHAITMQRTGYQMWQKSIDLTAGSVLWLNYARLVPTTLTPKNVADFATVTSTAASPNNKVMAIKDDPATPVIRLADLSQDSVKVTDLQLPATSYSAPSEGKTQQFVIDVWDPSSRYLLVKHIYDDGKLEWLVVDVGNPDATKNITTMLGVEASKVLFSNDDSKKLYIQVDTEVRRVDINAATLSGPLVANVAEFSLYKQSIIYVTLPDPTTKLRTVGYYDESATATRPIRTFSDAGDVSLHAAVGKYFDDTYVAISYGDTIEIMKGDLPRSDTVDPSAMNVIVTMTIPGGTQYVSIVTNGRFVVAQTAHSYVVYDLELKKTTTTTLPQTAALSRQLRWLDGYTIWSDQNDSLRLYEFDGANQHTIMPVVAGFSVTLSPSDKYLYGISKADDGTFHLSRVQMIL